jgi:hypothetical protein
MATKRTSYDRKETDKALQDASNPDSPTKDPAKLESEAVSSGFQLPAYEGEDDLRRGSVIVTTAEDLVTQVIGVEDDPSR